MIKNTKFMTFETFDIVMLLAFGVLNAKNLNNITRIFTHFFTHIYFQKIQITLLKQHYQTALSF